MSSTKTDNRLTRVNADQVYEVVDTTSGLRYVGHTTKALQTTRLPQHFAEARAGRNEGLFHKYLRQVIDAGREGDIIIRPLPEFETEMEATNEIGLDNLLNEKPGDAEPKEGCYEWTSHELDVIETKTVEAAAQELNADYNRVRDTAAQLNATQGLSKEKVRSIWTRYHSSEEASYNSVAQAEGVSRCVVGGIIREETYADIQKPAPHLLKTDRQPQQHANHTGAESALSAV